MTLLWVYHDDASKQLRHDVPAMWFICLFTDPCWQMAILKRLITNIIIRKCRKAHFIKGKALQQIAAGWPCKLFLKSRLGHKGQGSNREVGRVGHQQGRVTGSRSAG